MLASCMKELVGWSVISVLPPFSDATTLLSVFSARAAANHPPLRQHVCTHPQARVVSCSCRCPKITWISFGASEGAAKATRSRRIWEVSSHDFCTYHRSSDGISIHLTETPPLIKLGWNLASGRGAGMIAPVMGMKSASWSTESGDPPASSSDGFFWKDWIKSFIPISMPFPGTRTLPRLIWIDRCCFRMDRRCGAKLRRSHFQSFHALCITLINLLVA